MTDFDTFWADARIPPRMKRCGPAPVRKFIKQRGLDSPEGHERILASLPGYERNKADYADYCMLSTYVNQERDLVDWDEMVERPLTVSEQKQSLQDARVKGFQRNGFWIDEWGDRPGLKVVR